MGGLPYQHATGNSMQQAAVARIPSGRLHGVLQPWTAPPVPHVMGLLEMPANGVGTPGTTIKKFWGPFFRWLQMLDILWVLWWRFMSWTCGRQTCMPRSR